MPTYQDFLGVGGTGTNPQSGLTPAQIAENERIRKERAAAAATISAARLAAQGRVASGYTGNEGTNHGLPTTAPGTNLRQPYAQQWTTPLDGIPGIGNTLGAVVQAPFKFGESVAKEAYNNPGRTFLTGGTNLAVAGVDRAVDTLATGAVRDATGRPNATVNLPLTPAQLYDPNHPLYESGNGYALNVPGIKDIGNGIAAGARAVGGALSGALGGGSGGSTAQPGAGGNPAALAAAQQQYATDSARGAAESAAMGANVSRVQGIGAAYEAENRADAQRLTAQGAAAANRAAPQITAPSSANQQAALNAAANFQANTSGVAGIRGATADTSGAQALSSFRGDMQGINALDRFQAENTAQGVRQLNAFQPTNTQQGVDALRSFQADNTAEGIAGLNRFRPEEGMIGAQNLEAFRGTQGEKGIAGLQSHSVEGTLQGAQDLQDFRTSTSGINNLNAYANEGQGPSRAEALLRSQSDQDKRTAIALARSARGGPAAIAQAMRQAQSEGAAIAAETRGQAAALSAQEFDTYKQRQLASLQSAGALISNADAQRLQALADAGQLLSNADQQKLAAFQSIAQARTAQDMQRVQALATASQARTAADSQTLSARTSAGQLGASIDAQNLQARTAAGQLQSNMDQQRLGAQTAAGQLQSNMDAQSLGARTAAGQLRAQNDATRMSGLQSAGNILLQGSAINQQGQIAATQAELAGSAQKLQALSLQGQISSDIRGQDIDVLKSNLSASLQQMNLNDTQVRTFAQMGQDAKIAGQNLNMQANQMGINAEAAQRQLALQWDAFAQTKLTDAQQLDLQNRQLAAGIVQNQDAGRRADRNFIFGLIGTGLTAASDERAKKNIKPVSGKDVAQALRDSPGSEYEYTEPDKPGRKPGKLITPMAQGLQKSKLFSPAVSPAKDGTLMVDGTRLALAHHTALSHLQKEIDLLKKLRKAGKKDARA